MRLFTKHSQFGLEEQLEQMKTELVDSAESEEQIDHIEGYFGQILMIGRGSPRWNDTLETIADQHDPAVVERLGAFNNVVVLPDVDFDDAPVLYSVCLGIFTRCDDGLVYWDIDYFHGRAPTIEPIGAAIQRWQELFEG